MSSLFVVPVLVKVAVEVLLEEPLCVDSTSCSDLQTN